MINIDLVSSTKFNFWREMILATILIGVVYICYIILVLPLSQMSTLALSLPFMNSQSTNAINFTTVTFGIGFILLALGLLAWGVGSAFRRGEDSARF